MKSDNDESGEQNSDDILNQFQVTMTATVAAMVELQKITTAVQVT